MTPKTFAVVVTVDDPLTAERLVDLLTEQQIDAFTRAGGAASTAGFEAASPGFWDLFVPSDQFERASTLVRDELVAINKDAEANALAAEEEALSGETPVAEG